MFALWDHIPTAVIIIDKFNIEGILRHHEREIFDRSCDTTIDFIRCNLFRDSKENMKKIVIATFSDVYTMLDKFKGSW